MPEMPPPFVQVAWTLHSGPWAKTYGNNPLGDAWRVVHEHSLALPLGGSLPVRSWHPVLRNRLPRLFLREMTQDFAGIWKDHPEFDAFLENIAEYRRSVNGPDASS